MINGLDFCFVLQEVSDRVCVHGAGEFQRDVYIFPFHPSGVATSWHCKFLVVSSDTGRPLCVFFRANAVGIAYVDLKYSNC